MFVHQRSVTCARIASGPENSEHMQRCEFKMDAINTMFTVHLGAGKTLQESDEIVKYLFDEYGNGKVLPFLNHTAPQPHLPPAYGLLAHACAVCIVPSWCYIPWWWYMMCLLAYLSFRRHIVIICMSPAHMTDKRALMA